jgi:hypothetical protein
MRIPACILSFWSAGFLAAGVLALGVFAAPGSRSSPVLAIALFALAFLFWRAAMGLWRIGAASASRLRTVGMASGPLFALAGWSVSAPAQRLDALLAVFVGWLLFLAGGEWLARRVSRHESRIAPAS